MLSYSIYKVIHLSGIFMILVAYGAILLRGMQGQTKGLSPQDPANTGEEDLSNPDSIHRSHQRLAGATHGLGLLLALVGGFGLIAKLQIHWPWPLWLWLKFSIWIVYGFASPFVKKGPGLAKALWFLLIALAITAAILAQFKPY